MKKRHGRVLEEREVGGWGRDSVESGLGGGELTKETVALPCVPGTAAWSCFLPATGTGSAGVRLTGPGLAASVAMGERGRDCVKGGDDCSDCGACAG